MSDFRVRFAPSPTGALHIGGIRTALYNYLLAKKMGGVFILRIEDTDQNRYVPGAEEYIIEALEWCGLSPDEGPGYGGHFGPYRQSERKAFYQQYARQLIDSGFAYYAFDTPEELEAMRLAEKEKGNHTFKYDARMRKKMRNSLTLPKGDVEALLARGEPYAIRLQVPEDEVIAVVDQVRGEVQFQSNELDDKIILKADGMPTYHLANVVDDRLMRISHVIRGEEWLPSTAHHVLLYRFLGWAADMPAFAHLPLILKPDGKGKLSKRDGARFGFPVFPLSWDGETAEDSFEGFREFGFDPRAVVNFLAFLGWNPGTEQEIFSLDELVEAFSIDKIGKAGARFDIEKAKWFNQQYLMTADNEELARAIRPLIEARGHQPSDAYLTAFCGLMKERVVLYPDFWEEGYYFFEPVRAYDDKNLRKRWKPERLPQFQALIERLEGLSGYTAEAVEESVKSFMEDHGLKFGDVLPILRIALAGTMKGPAVFDMMALLGKEEVNNRLEKLFDRVDGA
jgi:glutamyl-tRNA synthetase